MISKLNDDCLLAVFNCVFNLEDLGNFYRVCRRWQRLVKQRLVRVKYALGGTRGQLSPSVRWQTLFIRYHSTEQELDTKLKHLMGCLGPHMLPNLRVIDFRAFYFTLERYKKYASRMDSFFKFITNRQTIEGIIDFPWQRSYDFNKSLEMLQTSRISRVHIDPIRGPKLKQLTLNFCANSLIWENVRNLTNLEVLTIVHNPFFALQLDCIKIGLPKLKILVFREINTLGYKSLRFITFDVIDSCPKLESVRIDNRDSGEFSVNRQVKNLSIQNFVIQFPAPELDINGGRFWKPESFQMVLTKYPNIKHLAVRRHYSCDTSYVYAIIESLPKLVLLDMRGCPNITQSTADWVDSFNKYHNRSIKLMFGPFEDISSPSKVVKGRNFMRTHFFQGKPPVMVDL